MTCLNTNEDRFAPALALCVKRWANESRGREAAACHWLECSAGPSLAAAWLGADWQLWQWTVSQYWLHGHHTNMGSGASWAAASKTATVLQQWRTGREESSWRRQWCEHRSQSQVASASYICAASRGKSTVWRCESGLRKTRQCATGCPRRHNAALLLFPGAQA